MIWSDKTNPIAHLLSSQVPWKSSPLPAKEPAVLSLDIPLCWPKWWLQGLLGEAWGKLTFGWPRSQPTTPSKLLKRPQGANRAKMGAGSHCIQVDIWKGRKCEKPQATKIIVVSPKNQVSFKTAEMSQHSEDAGILYYDNCNSYPMLWSHDLLHNISWYIMTIPTPFLSMFIPTFPGSPGAFLGSSNRGLRCKLRVGDRAQRGPTRRLSHAAGFLCRRSSFFGCFFPWNLYPLVNKHRPWK